MIAGVTYNASYLGCCSVIKPSGEEATAEAVKTIVQAVPSDCYHILLDNNNITRLRKITGS